MVSSKNGASLLVQLLEQHGVTHVFGIPGAKVDSVFMALKASKIELVLCRHEQNAAFMAQAFGRLTGKVGVCLVTSGPGVTNLVTGLATATYEGDPVLAIGGEVMVKDRLKHTHQALNGIDLMRPVTKYAAEPLDVAMIPEVFGNAVRAAESGRPGAVFIGFPKDVGLAPTDTVAQLGVGRRIRLGPPDSQEVCLASELISQAQRPLLLLGLQSSEPCHAEALKAFLDQTDLPFVSTFQGAGAWAEPRRGGQYAGRVGLFSNQPADRLLEAADCVVTVGYDPIEYDPEAWNKEKSRPLIVIDSVASDQDRCFLPAAELIADIGLSLEALGPRIQRNQDLYFDGLVAEAASELAETVADGPSFAGFPVHPLRVIDELRKVVTSDTTVALDVGSHYIWMNRYFPATRARQVLVSNGQQTLGVALPWAIAAGLARPQCPVISVSGDGGFLFSAMELETAKRVGSRFVHLIWNSASYDMVAFQEEAHYGETSGVELGSYDVVAYAKSFGCQGYRITDPDQLGPVLKEALASPVPVLIDIPIDYSDNSQLMQNVRQDFLG